MRWIYARSSNQYLTFRCEMPELIRGVIPILGLSFIFGVIIVFVVLPIVVDDIDNLFIYVCIFYHMVVDLVSEIEIQYVHGSVVRKSMEALARVCINGRCCFHVRRIRLRGKPKHFMSPA